MEKLTNSIAPLLDRIDAVEAAARDRGDSKALQEITVLRSDLEEVDLSVGGSEAESDDPDFASRLLERVRNIRKRLVRLQNKTGSGATSVDEIKRAKVQAGPASEITNKLGTEMEKRELAALTRELEQAGRRGDARSARRIADQMASLGVRVRFNQASSWKEAFDAQQEPGRMFVSQEAARKWLEVGKQAVRKGDSTSLQEAVRHLWKLRPKSDPISESERALETILTKS
jgi:hypothetical protein